MTGWWSRLRRTDELELLQEELEDAVRSARTARSEADRLAIELTSERARRVSAETLAGERRDEVERLTRMVEAGREEVVRISGERLRSLDALNVKLLEPRVEAPPPDLSRFRRESAEQEALQVIQSVRQRHREMDFAIASFGMKRPQGPVANAPQPPPDAPPEEKN